MTNGEHEQIMRKQERDLSRIANAMEMANQLKVLELAIYHEQGMYKSREARDRINNLLEIMAKRNNCEIVK